MRRANTIDEEQLPETKLIEGSFLLNIRMKIIISVCFFHDRVYPRLIRNFCVTVPSRLSWAYIPVHYFIQRILFVLLSCLWSSKSTNY